MAIFRETVSELQIENLIWKELDNRLVLTNPNQAMHIGFGKEFHQKQTIILLWLALVLIMDFKEETIRLGSCPSFNTFHLKRHIRINWSYNND